MAKAKWPMAIFGVVLIGLAVTVAITSISRKSDREQIQEALMESISASKEGRPGGVMELLSRNLKLNNIDIDRQNEIAKFIREQKPDIAMDSMEPAISGDKAVIKSPVHIKYGIGNIGGTWDLPDVKLTFKRENATQWGFIPVKAWKLEKVEMPEMNIPSEWAASGLPFLR